MKLIHDLSRYSDGRKVRLGDVVEWTWVSRKQGAGVLAYCDDAAIGVTVRTDHGDLGLLLDDPSVTLHRRATRREYFELVGMPPGDMPWDSWYHGMRPSDRYDVDQLDVDERMATFETWLDEPMFNEEGELL